MIGTLRETVETGAWAEMRIAKMGRRTYWHGRSAAVGSPPLGDANRGMCPWPCKAAVSTVGRPAALTPPSGGLFRFSGLSGDGSPLGLRRS